MAVKKVPSVYQASDGVEFETELEAERHEQFIIALHGLEVALAQFNKALAQTHLMGDGTPFTCKWGTYYYLTDPLWHMPELVKLCLSFDLNPQFEKMPNGKLRVGVTRYSDKPRDERVDWFEIERMFADERAGNAALLAAQATWLAEQTQQVAESRAKLLSRWPDILARKS